MKRRPFPNKLALLLSTVFLCGYSNEVSERTFRVEMQNSAVQGFTISVHGRQVSVRPGACTLDGKKLKIRQSTPLTIAPCRTRKVINEPFLLRTRSKEHPLYDLVPESCCAGGSGRGPVGRLIVPGSLRVKSGDAASNCTIYKQDRDYRFNPNNDTIERISEDRGRTGAIPVLLDYELYERRVDSIVVLKNGSVALIQGSETQFAPVPPKPPAGSLLLANILAPVGSRACTEGDVMVAERSRVPNDDWELQDMNDSALESFKKKIESKKPVRVAFFGDSVTAGCFSSAEDRSFTRLFERGLKESYPRTKITTANFGVGGSNSNIALADFKTHVNKFRPDLIVVEFVNDLTLSDEQVKKNYDSFSRCAKAAGASMIVCLPHLPAPSYLSDRSWDSTAERTYYTVVRQLAKQDRFAVADVARRWQFADKDGLNPMLLLADRAVHPNDRGHEIYAEELLKCLGVGH